MTRAATNTKVSRRKFLVSGAAAGGGLALGVNVAGLGDALAQNVLGADIGAWLAGLGIAGLAVSLAAQDSIRNLFGSLMIFLDRPFTVGDQIQFDRWEGPVEEIGFRSTKLRTQAGELADLLFYVEER